MLKYALAVIAILVGYIGFNAWRTADKVCEIKIEKINEKGVGQVQEAKDAADSVAPSDDLAALCLRDKYCRDK